jgi:X box-binding protein 1
MAFTKTRTIFIGENLPGSVVVDRLEMHHSINVEDSDSDSDDSGSSGGLQVVGGTRKRRRLTNLSPEEKLMRRKLKNRVAAQTARDRKKQRMSELEEALAQMEAENKKLQAENAGLKASTKTLSKENIELKQRLHSPILLEESEEPLSLIMSPSENNKRSIPIIVTPSMSNTDVIVATGKLSEPESAALLCPLQKDQARTILSLVTMYYLSTAFTIISLMQCFTFWTNMPKVFASRSIKETQIHGQTTSSVQSMMTMNPLIPPWWGSHQRNWNPSMNL